MKRLLNWLLRRRCDYEHRFIVQSVEIALLDLRFPTVLYNCRCRDCHEKQVFAEPVPLSELEQGTKL